MRGLRRPLRKRPGKHRPRGVRTDWVSSVGGRFDPQAGELQRASLWGRRGGRPEVQVDSVDSVGRSGPVGWGDEHTVGGVSVGGLVESWKMMWITGQGSPKAFVGILGVVEINYSISMQSIPKGLETHCIQTASHDAVRMRRLQLLGHVATCSSKTRC